MCVYQRGEIAWMLVGIVVVLWWEIDGVAWEFAVMMAIVVVC